MAVPETDDTNVPSSPSARPSWETSQPRPAARPSRLSSSTPPLPASVPPPSLSAASALPPAANSSYDSSFDMDIRYDLAGNPLPGTSPPSAAPPSPFGYSAGPTAGVWPPPIGGSGQMPGGAQAYRNNSGEQSHLPPEIERLRWHWGAFFFPTYWTRRHGLRSVAFMIVGGLILLRVLRQAFFTTNSTAFIAACVFYCVVCLGVKVYFGLNGHKIGWRNRHFPGGLEQYFQVQSRWMWWGFGINLLWAVALGVFIASIAGTVLLGHHALPSPYGGQPSAGH